MKHDIYVFILASLWTSSADLYRSGDIILLVRRVTLHSFSGFNLKGPVVNFFFTRYFQGFGLRLTDRVLLFSVLTVKVNRDNRFCFILPFQVEVVRDGSLWVL